jgi:uncharacterized protein
MMDERVERWNNRWREPMESFARQQLRDADSGHGIEHVQRVVANAIGIARGTEAVMEVILPAAWLHDCVWVPKNSPQRSQASRLAAHCAGAYLSEIDYPDEYRSAIAHCIAAHSFSAGLPCETLEARIVQDADRLEAVGAIGLARCLMTGGAMGQRLYDPQEPFPYHRPPRDGEQSVDHFFAKLLGLHRTMQTESGRAEAVRRTEFLKAFLEQLAMELGLDPQALQDAIHKNHSNRWQPPGLPL